MQVNRAHSQKKEAPEIRKAIAIVMSVKKGLESLAEEIKGEETPKHRDYVMLLNGFAKKIPVEIFVRFLRGKDTQEEELERLRAELINFKEDGTRV